MHKSVLCSHHSPRQPHRLPYLHSVMAPNLTNWCSNRRVHESLVLGTLTKNHTVYCIYILDGTNRCNLAVGVFTESYARNTLTTTMVYVISLSCQTRKQRLLRASRQQRERAISLPSSDTHGPSVHGACICSSTMGHTAYTTPWRETLRGAGWVRKLQERISRRMSVVIKISISFSVSRSLQHRSQNR